MEQGKYALHTRDARCIIVIRINYRYPGDSQMNQPIRMYAANALHAAKIATERIAEDEQYEDGIQEAKAICGRIAALKHQLGPAEGGNNRYVGPGPQGLHEASMMLILVRGHILELPRTVDTVRLANEANDIRGDIINWFEDYDN